MFRDKKNTRFSELENGDTFLHYDGNIFTVHNIKKTKSGRIHFYITGGYHLKPVPYSHNPLKDRFIGL